MSNLFGTQFTRMNTVAGQCIQGIKQMSDFYYACKGLSLKIYSSKLTATHTHIHMHTFLFYCCISTKNEKFPF